MRAQALTRPFRPVRWLASGRRAWPAIPALVLLLLASGSASAECISVNVHTLALRFDPALPTLPLFDGRFNGRPAVLALDTGAFSTTLTANGAARLGLRVSDTATPASGAGGGTLLRRARVAEATVATATVRQRDFPVLLPSATPLPFDALAGADALFQNDLELDFGASEARFFATSGCGGRSLAYWGAAASLPLTLASAADRRPQVLVQVNGITLHAMFDTGSAHTVLSSAAARRLGLRAGGPDTRPATPVSGVGGQASAAWTAEADTIQIGTERLHHSPLRLLADPAGEAVPADIVFGMDFLRPRRVLFSLAQGRVYLSPPPK